MRVNIIDATLREGCQAPGVDFNGAQTLQIAQMLARIGVDMIECGHPLKGPAEAERVQALVRANVGVPILSHSRAKAEDIDAVAATGANWVGIFVGINHTTRSARIKNATVPQILGVIRQSVAHAKNLGLKVRYTVEDASRTSMYELQQAYSAAIHAGADRICYADTLGVHEPDEIANIVRTLRMLFPETAIEVHIHDDRGLALACSLEAMKAGANWISTSVHGLGERCGITDTLTLLANLHHKGMRDLASLPVKLTEVSALVAACSNSSVDDRRPVVGRNAYKHKARLHRLAMEKDASSYTWMAPDLVGQRIELVED